MLQPLGAQRAHVHEGDGAVGAAKLVAHGKVARKGPLDHVVVDLHALEHRAKGGVAAVVAPVGVDHLDLGDGGRAALAGKVLLAEGDVGQVHGQPALVDEGGQPLLAKLQEAVKRLHHGRLGVLHLEGVARVERGLAGLDGVDHVVLDGGNVILGDGAFQVVHLGRQHGRALALANQLDALAGAVGTLIKLPRQVLNGKHRGTCRIGHLLGGVVGLGLGEDAGHALLEQLARDALHIVAVHQPQPREAGDAQDLLKLMQKLARLDVKAGLLLNKDAIDHVATFRARLSQHLNHTTSVGDTVRHGDKTREPLNMQAGKHTAALPRHRSQTPCATGA